MTLLCIGTSHRVAPLAVLDRVGLATDAVAGLERDLAASPAVLESLVLATCNRVEVYADVARFHPAVADISELLAKHTGVTRDELTSYLYVHFEDRAVRHLFTVAAGLDSMVLGEQQILGQTRAALRRGQDAGTVGRALNDLVQAGLRTGKRVHAETGIDRVGVSVVSVALDEAEVAVGRPLADLTAVVVGAGAVSGIAVSELRRRGIGRLAVLNRTVDRARELTDGDEGARALPLEALPEALELADLVVSCTGSAGVVVSLDLVERAQQFRDHAPLVVVDLALPQDVDPRVGTLTGVTRVDLAQVAASPAAAAPDHDVAAAQALVSGEVAAFVADQAAQRVEPVVVSLRAHAEAVVQAELERLRLRWPEGAAGELDEVERTVRRVVSRLLHTPTVRMKQFASDPGGARYAQALHALFDLDPDAVALITAAESPADPAVAGELPDLSAPGAVS